MTDILARLRDVNVETATMDRLLDEAADEIERLRAALSWIEDQDPQVVDDAREKFGLPDPRAWHPKPKSEATGQRD